MGRRESGERELIVIAWLSIDISLGRGGIEGRSTGRPWWSRLSVCTPDAGSGSWCADQQPRVCVCRVHDVRQRIDRYRDTSVSRFFAVVAFERTVHGVCGRNSNKGDRRRRRRRRRTEEDGSSGKVLRVRGARRSEEEERKREAWRE